MPQQKGSKLYNTFVKGLNSDASPLTFPPNTSLDESNMRLLIDGSRRRRRGIDYEQSAILSAIGPALDTLSTQVISSHRWFSVHEDANVNFLVVQVFNLLYFFNHSSIPLSSGLKAFTVNLDTYLAPGKTLAGSEYIDTATVKGALFVCSNKIEPFVISYDAAADTISVVVKPVQVRDFTGVTDGLRVDEQPLTLSNPHLYNLYNQGWSSPSVFTPQISLIQPGYTAVSGGHYPSNTQQWVVGFNEATGDTNMNVVRSSNFGNTAAPKGHYILNAFYKDRSTVSGITGLAVETIAERPNSLAGYSGRVFFGVGSTLYYSQIIKTDLSNIGYCYQDADPTSKDVNDLIDSDGGTITITEAINIRAVRALGNALIIFADNGVWAVTGNNYSGFKATEFQITFVSEVNCLNKNSIVRATNSLLWWANTGIQTLQLDNTSGAPVIKSISDGVIQKFYNGIPGNSKFDSKGGFDPFNQVAIWAYHSEVAPSSNVKALDRLLILDFQLGAFYVHDVSQTSSTPFITDLIVTPTSSSLPTQETIVVGSTSVVVGVNTVVVTQNNLEIINTTIQYLTAVPTGTSFSLTVSEFSNIDFKDWFTFASPGIDYLSFVDTGYLIEGDAAHEKQAPYILVYFRRTESGYTGNDTSGYQFLNPSSCMMQAKWDWADSVASNKFSSKQQVYRFRQNSLVPSNLSFDNGFPVVVTKNKVRGRGKSLHLRFESESGKDMNLLGWHVVFNINSDEE